MEAKRAFYRNGVVRAFNRDDLVRTLITLVYLNYLVRSLLAHPMIGCLDDVLQRGTHFRKLKRKAIATNGTSWVR